MNTLKTLITCKVFIENINFSSMLHRCRIVVSLMIRPFFMTTSMNHKYDHCVLNWGRQNKTMNLLKRNRFHRFRIHGKTSSREHQYFGRLGQWVSKWKKTSMILSNVGWNNNTCWHSTARRKDLNLIRNFWVTTFSSKSWTSFPITSFWEHSEKQSSSGVFFTLPSKSTKNASVFYWRKNGVVYKTFLIPILRVI